MEYNESSLSRVKHLKYLAQRIQTGYATKEELKTVSDKVDGLVETGGEPNKLEAVKVNGVALPIEDKAVDVGASIAKAVSEAGHASFQTAEAVPEPGEAQENVLYLVMNDQTHHYDIYAKLGGKMELLDDTTVDLSGKVDKEQGKVLSSNDYTNEDKAKLDGLVIATDEEVKAMLDEVFGATA